MKASFTITTGLIFLLASKSVRSQTSLPKWEVGINHSSFFYQGDLSPYKYGATKTPAFGFGILVNRMLSNKLSGRANFLIGKVMANESQYGPVWRQERNFKFNSSVKELSVLLQWNIKSDNYATRQRLSPYVFGGIALSFVNVQRDHSNFNAEYFDPSIAAALDEDIQQPLPKTIFALPIGIGIRHSINDKLYVFGETSHRLMFNDYLDGFSKSGNPDNADRFYNYSVGVILRLNKNAYGCPSTQ